MANRKGKVRRRNSRKPMEAEQPPVRNAVDRFKELIGWKPSARPFRTAANRQCGQCRDIKPGAEFDVPVAPGRPDLNLCRDCLC